MSREEVLVLIDSEEKKTSSGKVVLRMTRYIDFVFFDPVTAIQAGLTPVVRYMVEEGLVGVNDTALVRSENMPLLYFAVRDVSCLEYLLSVRDTDVHVEGLSIHLCTLASVPATVLEVTLEHGDIDLNARDSDGFTALHRICGSPQAGRERVVKLKMLLRAGANVRVRADNGGTALGLVLVQLLAMTEAEPSADEDDATAVQLREIVAATARECNTVETELREMFVLLEEALAVGMEEGQSTV